MIAAFALSAGVGLGLVWLAAALVPARPNIPADIDRWERGRARAHNTGAKAPRLFTLAANTLSRHGIEFPGLQRDLAITGRTPEDFAPRAALLVLAGFLVPAMLGVVATLGGLGLPVEIPALVCLFGAAAAGVAAVAQLREEAKQARRDFRRSLSVYLDLVALQLAAGRGHPEALPAAAKICHGWAFQRLDDALLRARQAGVTPWEALADLGREYGIEQLETLGGALMLVGDEGAKVRNSLNARAETLRNQRIEDEREVAEQRSKSMSFAQVLVVVVFIAYLFYPTAVILIHT
ncbi:type II secretion system F family protein [Solicola gregarius]|uniref:Type II secretion system F family protein n=1 Tax=Solicola gregarius TaxID=2908642 RepID=A0AA46TK28_9ACTN|nr:type II secretion system F family protein [Solicola gregarius]UYM06317.1 type II secretion system F family protein [Solicola gregarius]